MANDIEALRTRMRSAAEAIANRSQEDEAVAILSETVHHESLSPSVLNGSSSLHDAIAEAAASWLTTVAGDELVPYEPGFNEFETQILTLTITEVPVLANTRPLLEPPDRADQFDINKVTLSRLRGYSYSAQLSHLGWIHFFRRLTRSNVQLKRQKSLLAWLVENEYELVGERGLRLETDFDAVVIGDEILVRSRVPFERLFDFAQMTIDHARDAAAAVVRHLSIRGADEFIQIVSRDRRMHSKLQSALEKLKDPEYLAKVTNERIAALVEDRNDIELELAATKDRSVELVFDSSPQRRWTLLKILDDDYLISELTESRYQAPSKHSGA